MGDTGTVKTTCYGKTREWESREQALAFFSEAIAGTDGSEQERYMNIYMQLMEGRDECMDMGF